MEGFGPIALFVLWALVSLLGRSAQRRKGPARQPRPVPPRREAPTSRTGQPTTFDELLAEMRGELERAKEMERAEARRAEPWRTQLPEAEEVEDATSLEEDVEVVSLEVEPYRPERPAEMAQSDAMQLVVQQRIAEAEMRNRAWRLEDHRRFDAAIRKPKPVVSRRLSRAHQTLRGAIIWNEVLQPPVALRDLTPRDG